MPIDLIHRMRELITTARAAGIGLWPSESLTTNTRLDLHDLAGLAPLIMFPKLYRRLVSYFRDAHTDLTGFDTWIRADPIHRDDRVLLPTGEIGNLHDTYNVDPDGHHPVASARTVDVRPRRHHGRRPRAGLTGCGQDIRRLDPAGPVPRTARG